MATRVLLIEDEPILVSLYSMVLVQAQYDVQTAQNAEIGEEKVITIRPHVVLLDLLIPKTSVVSLGEDNFHEPLGFEILRLVKNTPSLQDIRVIVLSNLDSDEHIRRARELGADDYIVKADLDPHQLTSKVEEAMHVHPKPVIKKKSKPALRPST